MKIIMIAARIIGGFLGLFYLEGFLRSIVQGGHGFIFFLFMAAPALSLLLLSVLPQKAFETFWHRITLCTLGLLGIVSLAIFLFGDFKVGITPINLIFRLLAFASLFIMLRRCVK